MASDGIPVSNQLLRGYVHLLQCRHAEKLWMWGTGYRFGKIMSMKRLCHMCHPPETFGTMCSGVAQELAEHWMIPMASILSNSASAEVNLSGGKHQAHALIGGPIVFIKCFIIFTYCLGHFRFTFAPLQGYISDTGFIHLDIQMSKWMTIQINNTVL